MKNALPLFVGLLLSLSCQIALGQPHEPATESDHAAHAGSVENTESETRSLLEASLADLLPKLNLGGFTDFKYHSTGDFAHPKGFAQGQFILHVSSNLSGRIRYFGELAMTARPGTGFKPSMERSVLKARLGRGLVLSAGRTHTPVTYWNTAFHHGQWLQASIDRPRLTRFGSEFVPIHLVGASLDWKYEAGSTPIGFSLGIGNGRQEDSLADAGDGGDGDGHRAIQASVWTKPFPMLRIGGSYYRDRISYLDSDFTPPPAEVGAKYYESIISAHAVLDKGRNGLIAEIVSVRHESSTSNANWRNTAWYVQVQRKTRLIRDQVMVYARIEEITVAAKDPVFCSIGLKGWRSQTLGARVDLGPFSALKVELRRSMLPGGTGSVDVVTQLSYTF